MNYLLSGQGSIHANRSLCYKKALASPFTLGGPGLLSLRSQVMVIFCSKDRSADHVPFEPWVINILKLFADNIDKCRFPPKHIDRGVERVITWLTAERMRSPAHLPLHRKPAE